MSILKTITEGGQIWTHRIRMLKQVLKIASFISILIWAVLFAYRMSHEPFIVYQAAWYHLQADIFSDLAIDKMKINPNIWEKVAHERLPNQPIDSIKVKKKTEPYFHYLITESEKHLKRSGIATLFCFAGVLSFFFIRGRMSKQKEHISGKKIVPAWLIAFKLRLQGKASPIQLGALPLVKGTETQHILVTGGTGSGKTNCFHGILPQLRSQNRKAIIVDTTGIFVERYFRDGKDILLNPCDSRSASWHPWIECSNKLDYESLAEGFIPQSYNENDNYWRVAARSLLAATLMKLDFSQRTSELANWLLFEPLSKLSEFVQGTKAASHIDLNSEKTASSVRSVTSAFTSCLEFLSDTQAPFSIRSWMNKDDDSWLFLSCKPIERAALNPLISCWFSVAARSLMQLTPSFERRIWFVIDELPTLNKLKDLETLLSEGRKYGACALLALQSPAQLNAIYGHDVTKTILGNCATKIIFSEQDPEIAEKISKTFGSREIKEYQEGLSYGANDIRDGVNLSLQTRILPLVSSTDIQFLQKNQAYIRLAGNIPIAKIKFKILN